MKIIDFYEKQYSNELAIRGQVISSLSLNIGLGMAALSGQVVLIFSFDPFGGNSHCGYLLICLYLLFIYCSFQFFRRLYKAYNPPAYKLLDDAHSYSEYFKELKQWHSDNIDGDGGNFEDLFNEMLEERYIEAVSNNRLVNYGRTYNINASHIYLVVMGIIISITYATRAIKDFI